MKEDGIYAKSCKYPSEGGERYREHMRRNVLQDLGIKLVEEIADTDQHYTIKVDTEDEEDLVGMYADVYCYPPRCRRFTARISVTPVQYRRMEMMIHEQPRVEWSPRSKPDCQSLWKRLWQWANEPIAYDGPMPSPRSVAATQKPTHSDPSDEHDLDWWDEQEAEARALRESP